MRWSRGLLAVARRITFCSLWVRVGGDRCGIVGSSNQLHDAACCGEVKAFRTRSASYSGTLNPGSISCTLFRSRSASPQLSTPLRFQHAVVQRPHVGGIELQRLGVVTDRLAILLLL